MSETSAQIETVCGPPMAWLRRKLEALPAQPLRQGVILTASERQAHAVRRFICTQAGEPQLLAGVRFARPVELARELLMRAGRVRRPGWQEIRRLHILRLFEAESLAPQLRYFKSEQLRAGAGYSEAFARTIADLEASGLDAPFATALAQRLAHDDRRMAERLHDVAITWAAADAGEGGTRTAPQLLSEAAELVRAHPECGAAFGTVLAVLTA